MEFGIKEEKPQPGDCWSLKSCEGGPDLPPAVVLIHACETCAKWFAIPLFMESGMASSEDLKLEPEPDFLFGETWCAAGESSEVDESRLYGKLGELDRKLFNALEDAVHGDFLSLRRGSPIIHELPDPRIGFHNQLSADFRKCGSSSALEAVVSQLRITVKQAGNSLSAFLDDLSESFQGALETVPIPAAAYRDSAPANNKQARWGLPLPGSGDAVAIEVVAIGDSWHLQLFSDAIKHVRCESTGGGRYEFWQLGDGVWTSAGGEPLKPGKYRLSLQLGQNTHVFDLDLEHSETL